MRFMGRVRERGFIWGRAGEGETDKPVCFINLNCRPDGTQPQAIDRLQRELAVLQTS